MVGGEYDSEGKVIGFICGPFSFVTKVSRSWLKCSFSLEERLENDFSSPKCENYSLNSSSERDSFSTTFSYFWLSSTFTSSFRSTGFSTGRSEYCNPIYTDSGIAKTSMDEYSILFTDVDASTFYTAGLSLLSLLTALFLSCLMGLG